jgi:hypothetical protein
MVADEVGGRPRARRGHSRWHGSARTSFGGVLELRGLSCKMSSRWWVAATWLAHTNEHVVCSVGESLQLALQCCKIDLHGMDTARRPVSETKDSSRLGRRTGSPCTRQGTVV